MVSFHQKNFTAIVAKGSHCCKRRGPRQVYKTCFDLHYTVATILANELGRCTSGCKPDSTPATD